MKDEIEKLFGKKFEKAPLQLNEIICIPQKIIHNLAFTYTPITLISIGFRYLGLSPTPLASILGSAIGGIAAMAGLEKLQSSVHEFSEMVKVTDTTKRICINTPGVILSSLLYAVTSDTRISVLAGTFLNVLTSYLTSSRGEKMLCCLNSRKRSDSDLEEKIANELQRPTL